MNGTGNGTVNGTVTITVTGTVTGTVTSTVTSIVNGTVYSVHGFYLGEVVVTRFVEFIIVFVHILPKSRKENNTITKHHDYNFEFRDSVFRCFTLS